jgi:hypothetical protein
VASRTFDVEVRGLDVLRAKLQTGRIFGPVKQEIIQRAAKEGQETAEEESKGRFGTKGFKGRMATTFEQGGLIARVQPHGNVRGIARVVEFGRKPGRAPPIRTLKPWAARAGITDIRDLQARIRAGGTRGVGFMEAGSKAADKAIRSGVPRAEREIEADFNR